MATWYEIKNKSADLSEIWLYDEIGAWGTGAKQFIDELKTVTAKNISLRINSPGGDVFDGVAIHNAIKRHPAKWTAYVDGIAASIASVIALAADKVIAAENAMYMIHDPWGFTAGNSGDMRHYADVLDKVRDAILTSYVSKTGIDEDIIKKMMNDETWMTAQEAFDFGFVDVVEGRTEARASANFKTALEKLNVKNMSYLSYEENQPSAESTKSSDEEIHQEAPQVAAKGKEQIMSEVTVSAPVAGAANEAAAIVSLCVKHGHEAKAADYISNGLTLDQVAIKILDANPAKPIVDPATPIQLSAKEQGQYSFQNAIKAAIDIREGRAASGFEVEVHQQLAKSMPVNYQAKGGIFMPLATSLTSTGSTTGGEVVRTQYGDLIDLLRAASVVTSMGASTLNGLNGPVTFPKQTGASTLAWTGEAGSAVAESNITLGTVTLSPKTAMAKGSLSRQLLLQSNPNAEQMIRNDLAAIAALGIDRAALHGAGSSNEPDGLYHLTGVNAVAMGGVPTFGKLVDMTTECAKDNALLGNLGFVTTPGMAGKLRQTLVASAAGSEMIFKGINGGGEMAGYKAMASNQVSSTLAGGAEHGIIFGNWSDLIIGTWGGIEITVDPYTLADQGLIRLILFLMADVIVRHPESFCKATGATI